MIFPYETLEDYSDLHIFLAGLVPQHDHMDHLIIEYTWSGINDATHCVAPDSMRYGRVLQRFLQEIYNADSKHGPVHMLKVDIANGFNHDWLSIDGMAKLGVTLPKREGKGQLITSPFILPMGWVESPPHCFAMTENSADLTHALIREGSTVPDTHQLEEAADAPSQKMK